MLEKIIRKIQEKSKPDNSKFIKEVQKETETIRKLLKEYQGQKCQQTISVNTGN
ncbi:MAG: hypothetical protein ABIJ40_18285 [Bacteroidota bacterium]